VAGGMKTIIIATGKAASLGGDFLILKGPP
jgi:hypothetical protein